MSARKKLIKATTLKRRAARHEVSAEVLAHAAARFDEEGSCDAARMALHACRMHRTWAIQMRALAAVAPQ